MSSMIKCQIEKVAREMVSERGLDYGMSIFDGKWYVGTPLQLHKAGVPGFALAYELYAEAFGDQD